MILSTLRWLMGMCFWRSFCAITSAEQSGSRKRWEMTKADDLGGASVIGFGACGARMEGGRAALGEGGEELVIALATVTELMSDLGDGQLGAFAQDEHGKMASDKVVGAQGELTAGALELEWIGGDGEGHGGRSREEEGDGCLIKYGGSVGC